MSASDSSNQVSCRDSHRIKDYGKAIQQSPKLSESTLQNDTKLLESGYFADCTVICGDQTWKAHKVILSRSRYFARAFSFSSGFKEAIESKITIKNFEPFEMSWLFQYIYGLRIDADKSKSTSPNKSFLETCVLLWGIGDFFLLADMCQSVHLQAIRRCAIHISESRHASAMLKEIPFLPDLEAGVRAAWRHDRVASPLQDDLMAVCVGIHPFVKNHASFISLLDEVPEFTTQYVKALLGCRGRQTLVSPMWCGKVQCFMCGKTIFNDKGLQATDGFLIGPPLSAGFGSRFPGVFCSDNCWQKRFHSILIEPKKPLQAPGNS